MKASEVFSMIKKLDDNITKCKNSPQSNEEYIQGLQHANMFFKRELNFALQKGGEQ